MSDTGIFIFGLFVSLVISAGFGFSVVEMRRIGREAEEKARKKAR